MLGFSSVNSLNSVGHVKKVDIEEAIVANIEASMMEASLGIYQLFEKRNLNNVLAGMWMSGHDNFAS